MSECGCKEKVNMFSRFGIRAYTYDEPSLGATFYLTGLGRVKKYPSICVDLWKISYTFGWSLIPEDGDEGTQIL